MWSGLYITGYYAMGGGIGGKGRTSGNWEVIGNLIQMRGPLQSSVYRCIALGRNGGDEREDPFKETVPNINISTNTCYTPFGSPAGSTYSPILLAVNSSLAQTNLGTCTQVTGFFRAISWPVGGTDRFIGQRVIAITPGTAKASSWPRIFPGTSRTSTGTAIWGKNVILGAAANDSKAGPYPSGTVWTGCEEKSDGSHDSRGDSSMPESLPKQQQ